MLISDFVVTHWVERNQSLNIFKFVNMFFDDFFR